MMAVVPQQSFLRSRSGHGLALYLCIAFVLAAGVAWGFHQSSLGAFTEDKSLVNAGVLGLTLFLVLGVTGVVATSLQWRQSRARAAVEASLRESEERFRDFASAASDWFWELDDALRFTYVSPGAPYRADQIIGKTRRELVGIGAMLSMTEAQLRTHESDLEAHRPFQNLRLQQTTPEGALRHFSLSGRPVFDAGGHFKGYRGVGSDVTAEVAAEIELGRRVEERTAQLRTAQNELVRREKLSTLGQLTATVAHELRNPLSAIRNTVFTLRESVAQSGLDLDRPLGRVDRNIQRCDRIISDLLDFTRVPELRCAPVDADQWLDEILAEQQLPDGVGLKRDFGASGAYVQFDTERLRCVVVNLVDNAAQAMAERRGGAITVRSCLAGEHYVLAIEDVGTGIPADILPKVFEPLFSTKSFGTGLGLPTVKQIVEQHGGTVEIASESGKGTRVVVRLPGVVEKELAA
jgi:PAS domain S-box-containing protein